MTDTSPNVIGLHVSQVPAAIEDVWPVIDQSGVVTEVVRTWDDADFVRLDRKGDPVDEIGHTHHLMPRRVFQATKLPAEWKIVGARRITREASQIENRVSAAGAKMGSFGDRQEYETLIRLNAEGWTLVGEIDANPPFSHIVEMGGVFYLAEFRPGHEPKPVQQSAAEQVTAEPATADAAVAAAAAPEVAESDEQEDGAANALAQWIAEVAAKEATAEARAPKGPADRSSLPAEVGELFVTTPEPPKASPGRASLLKAVVDPLDVDYEPPTPTPVFASAPGPDADLAATVEKRGVSRADILDGPVDERKADASMLVDEFRAADEPDAARAESLARAAVFITGAASGTWAAPEISGGMLTLEQVRKADRFAWDEYMNMYLPHVGFVAAVLKKAPSMGGGPDDVSFVPRSEQDVRPVGWHHLTDCDCPHCDA
jgi:hypothetical protein